MKTYYQDEYVTLYHGGCREVVPALGTFDLLLTDPPYGIGFACFNPILYYGKRPGSPVSPASFSSRAIAEANGHPCPKPIKWMTWCVEIGSRVGDTILDPFAGSGTTGVAAKRLNRKCTLIEKEEKYCEIAARRLSQGVLPLWEKEVE